MSSGFDPAVFQLGKALFLLAVIYFIFRRPLNRLFRFISRGHSEHSIQPNQPTVSSVTRNEIVALAKKHGGEKAATAMEYSDEAYEAYGSIRSLGMDYCTKFFEHLELNGIDGVDEYVQKLDLQSEEARKSKLSPFSNEAANIGFQEALSISEKAAEEFKRVVLTLGEDVDIGEIREKIRNKYSKKSSSHVSSTTLNEAPSIEAPDNQKSNQSHASKPELSSKERMAQLKKGLSDLKQGVD